MAVVIRLRRVGRKNKDIYRVVVADKRFPRDGRFIEEIGFYDPNKDPADIRIKMERVDYWVKKGAQPSETVSSLLKKAKTGTAG
ncbi:MAG TPA: 30S ribosomal protein S16 [bacterium]